MELASASHSEHTISPMQIEERIPLGSLTTFQIGGPARYFARVKSVEDLAEALQFAKEKNAKVFFLGGGSNVLVDDAGFDGLVIKIEVKGVAEQDSRMSAGAGESWDALVLRTVENNLWGIENLSGIPGTVGGAVVQNIGAYGQALSQTLEWVEVYDTTTGAEKRLSKKEYQSGYRDSIFKREPGRYVVLRVALALSLGGVPATSYKDLAVRFAGKTPSLQEIRAAVLEIRAQKFPDLQVEGTAGSFFKNPIVTEEEAKKLQLQYPDMPVFTMPETSGIKVPLAWLLDKALHLRGARMGGARLFERQPLVIAAEPNTPSADVKKLAAYVQEKVREAFDIEIEPEVTVI